ncbi:MAG: TniQ family protein [Ktedonobacteraceae bacterium]
MQKILHLSDPAWWGTLPCRVAPYRDEWLPGLLLRCDEINQWECGTTLTHLYGKTSCYTKSHWIVPPPTLLDALSTILAVTLPILLKTTYLLELARCYGMRHANIAQLGSPLIFRLCPQCIEERQLLMRTAMLPHIRCCSVHQLALVERCQCNAMLQPFSSQSHPFICSRCGVHWACLPRLKATSEHLAVEQQVFACFEFFFTQGTPHLLACALRLIREKLKKEKVVQVRLLDGKIKRVEHYELTKASLGYLVDLLVSLDLSPGDLTIEGFSALPAVSQ